MGERLNLAWMKLPLAVRAIVAGFAVLLAGIVPWSALASANLQVGSTFPWAVLVELVYLAGLWWFLSGKGWPKSTSSVRRQYLRANAVGPRLLGWSIVAGSLFVSTLIALRVVGWLLVSVPPTTLEEFALFEGHPAWTVVPLLLMGAVVTGLMEEAAFRGYMQAPLEQRYSPEIAIGVVAVIFALAHLPSPLALLGFILGGVGWGLLAYLTDSILPGAGLHAAADAAVWLWVWGDRDSVESLLMANVLQGEATLPFVVAGGLTAALAIAAALAFGKLGQVRQAERRNGKGGK
jgi:membrane protease YdiL (CAAX protease family)